MNNSGPTYPQAAVIAWRRRNDDQAAIEVALITSRSGKRWVIPKGLIDPGETPAESAAREAMEEAGLAGVVGSEPIGRYRYRKWGGVCEVDVFLMRVTSAARTWVEDASRERRWLTAAQAARLVREPELAKLLVQLDSHMDCA